MIRRALVTLGLVVLWSAASVAAALDVATFRAHPPEIGTVVLIGYVVDTYACPPCPAGAQCKPCQGDHVTIADAPGAEDRQGLVILMPAAALAQFRIGQRYRIEAELRAVRGTTPFAGELHLRTAQPEAAP